MVERHRKTQQHRLMTTGHDRTITMLGVDVDAQNDFRVVQVHPTDRIFSAVISIRRATFGARYLDVPASVADDRFDASAAVYLAYVGREPAGTVRICTRPECTPFDYAETPGHEPVWPPLSQCIAMSQLAIAPPFQGLGLLRVLLAFVEASARQADRRFVVAGADVRLVPSYERCGWSRTGVVYERHVGWMSEFLKLGPLD